MGAVILALVVRKPQKTDVTTARIEGPVYNLLTASLQIVS
jgi:hypothetical protein